MSIHAARSRVTQARENLAAGRFDLVESALRTAEQYLAGVTDDEVPALRAEIATVRADLANRPTEEETRGINAARGKLRAARSRIEERQLAGIEDVLAAATKYLAPVRAEHRAAIEAEISTLRAELEGSQQPPVTAPSATAPSAPTVSAPSASALPSAPTDEEQRGITAARGKLRAARSRLEEDQLLGIDDVIGAAVGYLAPVRAEHRAAVDAEIAAMRQLIDRARQPATAVAHASTPVPVGAVPSGPTEEEQRGITAARGKLRTARSRIEEDQLLGIDDVIGAAVGYLAPVRAEHRAAVDAEIAAVRADIETARRKSSVWSSPVVSMVAPGLAVTPPAPTVTPPAPVPTTPPPVVTSPVRVVSTPSPVARQMAVSDAITAEEERAISESRSMMRLARRKLSDGQLPGIGEVVLAAARHLDGVRPAHRTAVESELGALRTEIIAMPGGAPALGPAVLSLRLAAGPAPAAAPPAAATAARALSEDEQASVSRARGRVIAARSALESRRLEAVGPALDEALALLARAPEASGTELRRDVDVLRGQLAEELRTQDRRKVMDEIERHLRSAENDAEYQHVGTGEEAVQRALRRLDQPDVAAMLSPEQIAAYRERAAALHAGFAATLRTDALARAKAPLDELERETSADVFAGLDAHEVLRKDRDLASLRGRVLTAIRTTGAGDPEIASVVRRVLGVDRKIAASATTWGMWRRDEFVTNDWAAVSRETTGWTQEALSAGEDAAMLDEPALPATRHALLRARTLLLSAPRRAATEPGGRPTGGEDPTATLDPRDMIEHMFAAASTKLAAAYIRLLDAAEQMAPPPDPFVLRRPAQIAYNAGLALVGTPHRDAIVARAEALDDRWRTAYVAATVGTYELYAKLAREAERKWPELRDSSNALPFDMDRTQPGTLLFIEAARDRFGWDYSAPGIELAMRTENALVAGACAPHVRAALQHALRVQRLDVSERIPMNLIGIVQNVGTIDVRTQLTLREQPSGRIIDNATSWSPQPCVYLHVVGLHVGPVIVFDMAAATG